MFNLLLLIHAFTCMNFCFYLSIYLSIYLSEVKVQSTKKAVDYWLHWSIRKNNLQIEVFRRKWAFKALFKEQCQHGSSHKEKMFKKLNTTLPRTRGPLWVTVWLRQKEKNKADHHQQRCEVESLPLHQAEQTTVIHFPTSLMVIFFKSKTSNPSLSFWPQTCINNL